MFTRTKTNILSTHPEFSCNPTIICYAMLYSHSARCLLQYSDHITLPGAKQKKSRTKKGDWPHIYLHIIYLYLSTFAVLSVLTRIRITVHTITVLQQQPIYLTTLTRLMHISLLLVIAPHRIHHTTAHGVYYGTVSI